MRPPARRRVAVASVLCVLALGITLAGPALATGTDALARSDQGTADSRVIEERTGPFAQADDDGEAETHVINITNDGEDVEYRLSAPGLEPVAPYVEVGEYAEDAENPDAIRGNTAFGVIGGGAYDTYRFTGPVEALQLASANVDELEVRIDGESVDPRTLDGEGTETTRTTTTTTTTTTATTTATATRTATETPTATETSSPTPTAIETPTTTETSSPTGTASTTATTTPSPTTAVTTTAAGTGGGNGGGGGGGFTLVMYVLIGVVSGLVLAASLAYVVRS